MTNNLTTIECIIPATRFGSKDIPGKEHWRVIGTTDINGKGTLHPLHSIDPFIFLDESIVPANVQGLGGGPHPHYGLSAITYLSPDAISDTSKACIQPWDNLNNLTDINHAGGLYIIKAGKGVVHDEQNKTKTGSVHQLQLWLNPGLNNPDKASYQLYQPHEIPVITPHPGATVRLLSGEQFDKKSPAKAPIDLLYLHVNLEPDTEISLDIKSDFRGFVYVLTGTGIFNKSTIHSRELGMHSQLPYPSKLNIQNIDKDTRLSFILASAKPVGESFYKILGSGGALIAPTPDIANKIMDEFLGGDINDFGK